MLTRDRDPLRLSTLVVSEKASTSAMRDNATRHMTPSLQPLAFKWLMYRYFFYGWLFQDACRGDRWQRNAAITHNREQAKWLPTYMRRSWVLAAILFGIAWFVEWPLGSPVLSAFFYVPSVLALPYNAVTVVCYFGLTAIRH
jgi:hypothetical protein